MTGRNPDGSLEQCENGFRPRNSRRKQMIETLQKIFSITAGDLLFPIAAIVLLVIGILYVRERANQLGRD